MTTLLSDVITYVRRIIKSASNQEILDATILDYINRFYTFDLPARIQLFELKRQYLFETAPNQFEYQFPSTTYQLIKSPVYCDGVLIAMFQNNDQFYGVFPELVMNEQPTTTDGTVGPFSLSVSQSPILKGYIDDLGYRFPYVIITAFDASGNLMYICDDGTGSGNLIQTDNSFQTEIILNAGTINYLNGQATNIIFNRNTQAGGNLNCQSSPYSAGTPRFCLFNNNTIKLYPVPDKGYKISFDCFITPTAFLESTDALPFAYMSEYLARGAARKILSDNGDYDQFQFYEPFFREQENLVLRRTGRQNSTQRTPTIFAQNTGTMPSLYSQF